MRVDLAVAS